MVKPQLTEAVFQLQSGLKEVATPKIQKSINKFMNSKVFKDFLTIAHNLAYLEFLKRIGWPLFIINDEILEKKLSSLMGTDEERASTVIMEYYSNTVILELIVDWDKCDIILNDRKEILKETVKAYTIEVYTLCVSSLTCQMSGIINDITALYKSYGVEFTEEELSGCLKIIEENDEQKN